MREKIFLEHLRLQFNKQLSQKHKQVHLDRYHLELEIFSPNEHQQQATGKKKKVSIVTSLKRRVEHTLCVYRELGPHKFHKSKFLFNVNNQFSWKA